MMIYLVCADTIYIPIAQVISFQVFFLSGNFEIYCYERTGSPLLSPAFSIVAWYFFKGSRPILRSDHVIKSGLSHGNVFLRHYGGQWKTAVEQEAGENIDCKRQYLTVQIVLTKSKTSIITVFPQLLKIMAKKSWHFLKWERKSG